MSEDRFGEMLNIARVAKKEGMTKAGRRELVIKTMANERLSNEPLDVKERSLGKYFEDVRVGSIPVLMQVVHSKPPTKGAILSILNGRFDGIEVGELEKIVDNWIKNKKNGEPASAEDENTQKVHSAIAKTYNVFEPGTDEIGESVSSLCDASYMKAGRSRMYADANRATLYKLGGVKTDDMGVLHALEHPTSVRAAEYFGIEKVLSEGGFLTEGKLSRPYMMMVVHGMADREDGADVVLGGGSVKPDNEHRLADEKVLNWFGLNLAKAMNEAEVFRGDVAIHRLGDEDAEVFDCTKDGNVSLIKRPKVGSSLSGSNLGLNWFSEGHKFDVVTAGGDQRTLEFSGFGRGFEVIQLEVSREIRNSSEKMSILINILSDIAVRFGEEFSEINSVSD